MFVQIGTANQPFTDASDANARWATYLALKASLEATYSAMKVRSLMLTPAASFAQDAGNLAGYAQLRTLIAAEGGLDVSDVVTTGTQITLAYSEDGAHLNQSGVDAQYSYVLSRARAIAIALGADA